MPRAGSPYGTLHQKQRRQKLPGAVCHRCGAAATELDHQPPISRHQHQEGSGCCRSLPSCGPCARSQGGKLSSHHFTAAEVIPSVVVDVEAGVVGRGPEDPVWDVPWLERLREVPPEGVWPRFMSLPHPDAVGSYGADAVAWLLVEANISLRWWQDLSLVRMLEHNSAGELCWLEVLTTTARQLGKSVLLRADAIWRLHQSARFREQQLILHTARDLQVAREVRRAAKAWAIDHDYEHREQNGSEEITHPDGSRWLVRSKSAIYGYSASLALADEAWGLPPEVIEDGLLPVLLERISPQLVLTSTANRKATTLIPERRAQALSELDDPGSILLIEWSAPRDVPIEDRAAWRLASPHWSPGRERLLEARLARVLAGQTLDPDEDDPLESFRCQYLNSWLPQVVTDPGEPLLDINAWMRAHGVVGRDARLFAAIEDHFGQNAAVAVVAREGQRFEIDAWSVPSWDLAVADVAKVFEGRMHGRLLVGPSMWDRIAGSILSARSVTTTETRSGLSLVRQLMQANRLMHDQTPELDRQLAGVKVRESVAGLSLVPGVRADLIKAVCWSLQAAHRVRSPGIH